MPIITVFTDKKNTLTKIWKEGEWEAPGHITDGHGEPFDLTLPELSDLIKNLELNQCLCPGYAEGFDDKYPIGKIGDDNKVWRSRDFFEWPDSGFFLIDIDSDKLGWEETWKLLCKADPNLEHVGKVVVPSVSNFHDGQDNKHWHIYFPYEGIDPEQYNEFLFKQLIIAGHGRIKLAKHTGTRLLRTIYDREAMRQPNREIFEAGGSPERLKHIQVFDGPALTIQPEIDRNLEAKFQYVKGKLMDQMAGKSAKIRAAWIKSRGLKGPRKHESPERYHQEILYASEYIKDNNGKDVQLLDLLLDDSWIGKGIPDPVNPWKRGVKNIKVGRDVARVRDGYIYSFYGGIEYHIKIDFKSAATLIEEATDQDELNDNIEFIFEHEFSLSEGELSNLAKVITKRSKIIGAYPSVGSDATTIKKELKSLTTSKEATKPAQTPEWVWNLNCKYGVGLFMGKAVVLSKEWDTKVKAWKTKFTRIEEYKKLKSNEYINIDGKNVPIFNAWEAHPERNTFDRVIFQPRPDVFVGCNQIHVLQQGGEYNLWEGYQANLDNAKSCEKILWHLKHVWCSGNDVLYDYLLQWFAELFQNPAGVGQPFLVLKSEQGAGKGIILDKLIGRILGDHYITSSHIERFTGRFNAHLSNKVLCVLNEVYSEGKKAVKSVLKTMIDEVMSVERKNFDAEQDRNYAKVIVTTNEEWAVDTEISDRRHVYLDVSDKFRGDMDYFKELEKEIENGGRESFLKKMLELQRTINLRIKPDIVTKQDFEDRIRSADISVRFLWELIENYQDMGISSDVDLEIATRFENWEKMPITFKKSEFFEWFKAWADSNHIKRSYRSMAYFYQLLGKNLFYVSERKQWIFGYEDGQFENHCLYEIKTNQDGRNLMAAVHPDCKDYFVSLLFERKKFKAVN